MLFMDKYSKKTKAIILVILFSLIIELAHLLIFSPESIMEKIIFILAASIIGFALYNLLFKENDSLTQIAEKILKNDFNINSGIYQNSQNPIEKAFAKIVTRYKSRIDSSNTIIDTLQKAARETEVEKTLMLVLEGARQITNARYAALAIFDDNKKVQKFLQLGMSENDVRKIHHYPEGKGLLGYIHESRQILRLDDLKTHSRSSGFPAGHPSMKSLLAIPLLFGDKSLGNLYVSDKNTDTKAFDEDDEQMIKVFGQITANVIIEKHYREEIIESKKYLESEVSKISSVINRLSEGDLLVEIEHTERKDEISKLKYQLNIMVSNLRNLLSKVKEAIDATASASNEISASTEEMSAGAKEQTVQASEVASAVEEMAKTILETSSNTSVAAETARHAGENATEGGKVVIQTISGMNRIAEVVMKAAQTVEALGKSSDQIGEIVQVIEDIADQTNLLALNAAIEAARAGEQGRGFAVVADEVRKLAERTTKATKEIADMIKKIQRDTIEAVQSMQEGTSEVETGKELANKAGTALEQIIDGTQKVSKIIKQVAAASEQQSKASEDISRNIEAITTVTHESASGALQIAKAAEDLSRLTVNLQDLVGRFKIEKQEYMQQQIHKREVYSPVKK